MNETFNLTKFFMSSLYKKPKQLMLKIVLIIALWYMFIQLATLNVVVYYSVDTHLFMFYQLTISNILIFALTCYLSTIQFFSFNEFILLASLPISSRNISTAKLISSIFVPMFISLMIQIPALILLIIDFKVSEFIKMIVLLPIINGFIVLLMLVGLSFANKIYYQFKSKTSYLMTNFMIMAICPLILIVLYATFSKNSNVLGFIDKADLESVAGWINLIHSMLNHLFKNVMEIPLFKTIIEPFVANDFSLQFVLICIVLIIINILIFHVIIHNTSINYYKNGIHDSRQMNLKGSRVHITENQWHNYLQREVWVIKSEAYFKMQVVLGVLLPPVMSLIFLILIKNDVFPTALNLTKGGNFDEIFSYIVLFLCCINNISGTPYSREGRYLNLLKSHPFHPAYVYFSKVIIASTMNLTAIGLSFIIFASFGHWTLETMVMLMVVASLVICYNLLTPLFDRKKPLTEWSNPSEAVKSNPNVLISLLYGMPLLIVMAILHFGLVWINIHSLFVSFIILMVVLATIVILVNKLKVIL